MSGPAYPTEAELLATFTAEHINRRHTVVVAGTHTLNCITCARLAGVPEPGTARGYLQAAKRRVGK